MFNRANYFFEPLIEKEIDLIAHSETEKKLVNRIILYRLVFVFLSQTEQNLRPAVIEMLKDHLYDYDLVQKLNQVNSNINAELLERSLSFILDNIQSRLENLPS